LQLPTGSLLSAKQAKKTKDSLLLGFLHTCKLTKDEKRVFL
jgi:hypothetical protein